MERTPARTAAAHRRGADGSAARDGSVRAPGLARVCEIRSVPSRDAKRGRRRRSVRRGDRAEGARRFVVRTGGEEQRVRRPVVDGAAAEPDAPQAIDPDRLAAIASEDAGRLPAIAMPGEGVDLAVAEV